MAVRKTGTESSLQRITKQRHSESVQAKPSGKCVFIGAATKAPTEIQIGNDLDAFFYFMQFYKMQKEDRKPDEDFIDYMALLITRSQSKEWEEC